MSGSHDNFYFSRFGRKVKDVLITDAAFDIIKARDAYSDPNRPVPWARYLNQSVVDLDYLCNAFKSPLDRKQMDQLRSLLSQLDFFNADSTPTPIRLPQRLMQIYNVLSVHDLPSDVAEMALKLNALSEFEQYAILHQCRYPRSN